MVLLKLLPPIFAKLVLSCHGGLSLHVPDYVLRTCPKSSCFIFIILLIMPLVISHLYGLPPTTLSAQAL